MDRTSDLDLALGFVIGRITEQAKISGQPLTADQQQLLKYLPSATRLGWYPDMMLLVPRNIDLERLCALGTAAYKADRQRSSDPRDWQFAFTVLTLAQHPMAGLLQLAGMTRHRAKWDVLALIVAASLPLVAAILIGTFIASDGSKVMSIFLSVVAGAVCLTAMLAILFRSRRIEKQQLEQLAEKCRRLAVHSFGDVGNRTS